MQEVMPIGARNSPAVWADHAGQTTPRRDAGRVTSPSTTAW